MRNYKIQINDIPPSNNNYMGNSSNFNIYRRKKEEWHWLIKAALKERPSTPIKKAIVSITYFFKDNRRRDPDNYSGKFILDPLVKEGVLSDDSFDVVTLKIQKGEACRDNPHTVIEVTEIDD